MFEGNYLDSIPPPPSQERHTQLAAADAAVAFSLVFTTPLVSDHSGYVGSSVLGTGLCHVEHCSQLCWRRESSLSSTCLSVRLCLHHLRFVFDCVIHFLFAFIMTFVCLHCLSSHMTVQMPLPLPPVLLLLLLRPGRRRLLLMTSNYHFCCQAAAAATAPTPTSPTPSPCLTPTPAATATGIATATATATTTVLSCCSDASTAAPSAANVKFRG